jgi:tripartite-type tricarboxylate transporter receptor subunit TctC
VPKCDSPAHKGEGSRPPCPRRVGALFAAALAFAGLPAPPARAQDYPTKPVTLIVPYTPGGSTEILARIVGQKLEERLGKSVIVENKPGAGTVIGSNLVAKSAPDGYTLLMATPTPMAINVTLHKQLPYDPAADLVPLVMVAGAPFALVVKPSLPVHSAGELIALAKEKPGQLTYGSGGPGAPHHLYAELLSSMTGIKMTHVPYKGTLPALNDVIAGHIDLMFSDIPPLIGVVATGKVRPIGVSTKARVKAFPDVPPLNDVGVPGFDVSGWFTIVAPAKTPQPVIERLHRELKAVMALPDVKAQIDKLSLLPLDTPSVPDMQTFVKSEIVRWGDIVKKAGIAGTQ